ncbi:MAG: DUF1405 domain-containing protein [Haloferacaceae archaeon]
MRGVPERYAEQYLGSAPSLVWLLVVNAVAFLVGVAFYATATQPYGLRLAEVPTFVYPLYGDSPTALALATLSVATLLPNLGRPVRAAPRNRPLAYLHTLAFVWLVKYGLWTVVALLLRPDLYVFAPGALWAFWGITITHLGFVVEAFLIPNYGATTRGALVAALAALLLNDAVDYALGFHPPLRYDPGPLLVAVTVALSVAAVALAARSLDPLASGGSAGRSS